MPYQSAYDLQTRLVAWRRNSSEARDVFLMVEHPSVYTLGRRGGREHLSVSEEFLAARGIGLVPIERGGEITYHGPGQLVIYPILHLQQARLSVVEYVRLLEELMIAVSAHVGIKAIRDCRNHGVWVDGKKLGSIGIAIRHGVSFHGLALNVNPDMEPFSWINPCGLTGVRMTSLSELLGRNISVVELTSVVHTHLQNIFTMNMTITPLEQLPGVGDTIDGRL